MTAPVAVILAAGKGVRMKSEMPKVLHPVAGLPMVMHVVRAARSAGVQRLIAVVGHGRQQIAQRLQAEGLEFAVQEQQLGTGHALMQVRGLVGEGETVLVLCGDTPLLRGETLRRLLEEHRQSGADASVLTSCLEDPRGYGRIVRNAGGDLVRIVEEKDASAEERAIREVNAGIYCFCSTPLFQALDSLSPDNAQGEYYLTDVLPWFLAQGLRVATVLHPDAEEILGINDRVQLAQAEQVLRQRKNRELMLGGVTIVDPSSTLVDCGVSVGEDTVLYPFTILEGSSRVGRRCRIGPGAHLIDARVADDSVVDKSTLWDCQVGEACQVGPYAYLRPGACLERGVKVGDFVEIKKSVIGQGSKVPHLAYVGDAEVGSYVNIGAGTITCNYDGRAKYKTVIEDHAFIGSNTNLVAPVKVGYGAITGAGSTITKEVPPYALGVERARQRNISGWGKPEAESSTSDDS